MPLPESAELFLKYDYAELKDLCEHFLTVVSAILVFSLTFSEKILGFPKVVPVAKIYLTITWGLFLGAILACGVGLALIALAAGDVVYNGIVGYPPRANAAISWIFAAGALFIGGLLAFMITALIAMYSKRTGS